MKNKCRSVVVRGKTWHYAVHGVGHGTVVNVYRPDSKTVAFRVGIEELTKDRSYWTGFSSGGFNDCAFPEIGPGDVRDWIAKSKECRP